MKFLGSRKGAALLMVLIIAFSSLYGTHRSLSSLAFSIENGFYHGAKGSGQSIQTDLDKRMALAYNQTVVARRYLSESDAPVEAVYEARNALAQASTPGQKFKANVTLTEATTSLHETLGSLNLTEEDENYRHKIWADLTSRNNTIATDSHGYNTKVEYFNKVTLGSFPVSILRYPAMVSPLETFQ